MDRFIGLDFGTTNSSLAACTRANDEVTLARFESAAGATTTFRSVLFFDPGDRDGREGARPLAGPRAIERYLASDGSGRLIQSLKSYLASRLFQTTNVFGRTYALDELIALILLDIRRGARDLTGDPRSPVKGVVVGRPVRYSNAESEADEQLALDRLRKALGIAGFEDVRFEYEPVGAAYFYESRLDHDELVMIGDFGGGTSDFCLMRVGPGARALTGRERILGTEGVGLAGDAFDSEIVEAAVSPRLGMGSQFRSFLDGKVLPVPPWIYAKLRRWHHLSFLKSRETMHFLKEIRAQSLVPEQIDGLLHLIDYDLGYHLYKNVEGAKVALSSRPEVTLDFRDPPIDIYEPIARPAFEKWIDDELAAIRGCIDRLLEKTGAAPADVDRVFLTGGSSLVPAVRKVFEARFGRDKLRSGDELTSVAMGLALRARDP
jgi:hypothetical chaperone protein